MNALYRSIAEITTDLDVLVRTLMVMRIAIENVGHLFNRAPILGAIVSAARILGRTFDMNLTTDPAVSHVAPRNNGDRI